MGGVGDGYEYGNGSGNGYGYGYGNGPIVDWRITQLERNMIGRYVIARTHSSGVFAGFLRSRNGKEVVLSEPRRLWYWDGAASLSQLAVDGVSKPENCKFPVAVYEVLLTEVIEIIPTTEKAKKSIDGVKIWAV